jgi:hypothetical protein
MSMLRLRLWTWFPIAVTCLAFFCPGSVPVVRSQGTPGDSSEASAAVAPVSLPDGGKGLAARYSGDVGLGKDPAVLVFEDFETGDGVDSLTARWDTVHHREHMALARDPGNVFAGRRSLECTLPQQDTEFSHAVATALQPVRSVLFLRYYARIETSFDVVGSSHNGCMISGRYFVNGAATPGVPADGRNKFLAALEHWRGEAATPSPGELNVYLYHPEQRSRWGDHFFPNGTVLPNSSQPFDFGPAFIKRPNLVPPLGRWHCYEFMVALNTPGRRDGRIAAWLDGRLVADFGNLRLRDVAGLQIDRFGLNFHAHANTRGPARQWFDNVVAATEYIGPLSSP